MNKIKPISPAEVKVNKLAGIPDAVFEAFNTAITKNFDGHSAFVRQEEIVSALVKMGHDRHSIFENHWLDIEPVYEKQGWKVEFDKPGYNESYDANFTFTPNKKWKKSNRSFVSDTGDLEDKI
jgi:hypothetical protein